MSSQSSLAMANSGRDELCKARRGETGSFWGALQHALSGRRAVDCE